MNKNMFIDQNMNSRVSTTEVFTFSVCVLGHPLVDAAQTTAAVQKREQRYLI